MVAGNIIRGKTFLEKIPRKQSEYVGKRNDASGGGGIKPAPATDVLFRPEEIHGASGMGETAQPLGEGHRNVAYRFFGRHLQYAPVLDFKVNR